MDDFATSFGFYLMYGALIFLALTIGIKFFSKINSPANSGSSSRGKKPARKPQKKQAKPAPAKSSSPTKKPSKPTSSNKKATPPSSSTLEMEDLIREFNPEPVKTIPSLSVDAPSIPSPEKKSDFDLEHEVKQLMARTGWDYSTAKSYCQLSLDYHKKVRAGATLKK
jgi:hypothetical protein